MNERILNLLTKYAKKPGTPAPDDHLFDDGYLDSFGLADFAEGLEQEFGIKVADADMTPRKFETLQKIAAYVESRQ